MSFALWKMAEGKALPDTVPPSVTINKAATQDDPTGLPTITFMAVFSEAVTGFTAADVSTAGSTVAGTLTVSVMGSGSIYSVIVAGATGNGNVVASIPAGAAIDAAGNASLASTSTDNVVAFNTSVISDYPDQTNTGVIAGSILIPSGSVSTSANGQTIQNLDISGGMSIDHNNVTVRNCRIRSTTGAHLIWVHDTVTGPTQFIDCTVNGLNDTANAFFLGGNGSVTILRCNIFGFENGVTIGQNNVTVKDSYVHDPQAPGSDPHYDLIEIDSGNDNLLIDHCSLVLDNQTETACVNYNNFFGTPFPSNSLIIQNSKIIDGGGFPILGDGRFQSTPLRNITVQNNLIRKASVTGIFCFFPNVINLTWTNNTDIDTNTLIPNPGTDFDNSGNPIVWADIDGRALAPTGAAQHPTLFSGYPVRPPWQVAGVDYRVGVNTGVTLKDPSSASLPSGVSRSGTTFTVTGANVTLDAWNFTQGTGWSVEVQGPNCRVTNCRFAGNQNIHSIRFVGDASNLYVGYCEMNGNALTDFLIDAAHPGLTVEYCYIHNSASDLIGRNYDMDGGGVTLRYSLFEQAGLGGAGTHGDYLQVFDPALANISIKFTTSIQTGGITQGWIMDNAAAGECAYNTMIGSCSYWVALDIADITGAVTVHHNYFDITAATGFAYPGGGVPGNIDPHWNFHDNVNLVTGLLDENDTGAPTSATDNFNRANGGLGSNWGTDRGTLTIVSNQVKGGTAGTNCVSYRTAETFSNNQYSQFVWQGGGNGAGPVVRHNGSNPGNYYLSFFNGSSGINISKVTAGGYSTLASIGGIGFNPGDVYRLEVTGNTLTVLKNGASIGLSFTDTTSPYTAGRPGFEIFDVNAIVDDWAGGNLP